MSDLNCSLHSQNAATFTCERCGAFGCDLCASPLQPSLCSSCESRRLGQVGGGISATDLMSGAWTPVIRNFGLVAALAGIETVTATGFNALNETGNLTVMLVALIPRVIVALMVQAAWILVLAANARGESLPLGEAFRRTLPVLLPLFVANLFAAIGIFLGSMLCIVPGVIATLGLCLAAPIVVLTGKDGFAALTESWNVTTGHKGTLFVAYLLMGTIVLVGALVAAVGVGVVGGAASLPTWAIAAPITFLTTIIVAPLIALPVIAWLRLAAAQYDM